VIYLLTGKAAMAAGFMIVSNIYTTFGYFIHERVWAGIKWVWRLRGSAVWGSESGELSALGDDGRGWG
jgi:uncharacterized membrane protein